MVNPKILEAWLTLMTEGARGATPAQDVMNFFLKTSLNPEEMQRWMKRFMVPDMISAPSEDMSNMYEEWYRLMGFVPRTRYLELLERYEILRQRLEESEEKIRNLQLLLGGSGREEDAKKLLDFWGLTLEKTLQAQSEWMKGWMSGSPPPTEPKGDVTSSAEANQPTTPTT